MQPFVTNYVGNHSDCFFNISEERHLVLRDDGCHRLSEGRGNMSETCLWTASSLSGTLLFSMDVTVLCI